jgi:RNA-directed DNA polymerase
MNYFRLAEVKGTFDELDSWVTQTALYLAPLEANLYCAKHLMQRGLAKTQALKSAMNGRGPVE